MIVINSAQTPPSRATRTAGDYAEATLKAKSRWSVKYGSIRRLDMYLGIPIILIVTTGLFWALPTFRQSGKGDVEKPSAVFVQRPSEARGWMQILARYRAPSLSRSISEIVITAVPFALLWFLMWATLDLGYWPCLLLAVPAAGFLVRLFMIQHDCGHGAFFRHRLANDWVGRVIGVLTLTPYDFWRARTPCITPAPAISTPWARRCRTLTVREYLARSFGAACAIASIGTRSSCSA